MSTFDPKTAVRRLGSQKEYYEAQDGTFWTLNPQRGYVQVPLTSPALRAALSHRS